MPPSTNKQTEGLGRLVWDEVELKVCSLHLKLKFHRCIGQLRRLPSPPRKTERPMRGLLRPPARQAGSNCAACSSRPLGQHEDHCAACFGRPLGKRKDHCAACFGRPHGKRKDHCAACFGRPHGKRDDHCLLHGKHSLDLEEIAGERLWGTGPKPMVCVVQPVNSHDKMDNHNSPKI